MRAAVRTEALLATGAALALSGSITTAQAPLPPEYRAYLPDGSLMLPPLSAGKDDAPRRTQTLENSPRWTLAQADAGPGVLNAFACAAGVNLPKDRLPAVVKLLSRYRTDLLDRTRSVAPRPSLSKGPLCLAGKPLDAALEAPAVQSAWGWSVGLILAEALPDRAGPIMDRARAYGESSVICGTARTSEVQAGRDLAAMVLARMRAAPEFSADLVAAQAQIRALSAADRPAQASCERERAALQTSG